MRKDVNMSIIIVKSICHRNSPQQRIRSLRVTARNENKCCKNSERPASKIKVTQLSHCDRRIQINFHFAQINIKIRDSDQFFNQAKERENIQ